MAFEDQVFASQHCARMLKRRFSDALTPLHRSLEALSLAGDQPIEDLLAAFRADLLALDREVTGGKLPALVSWTRGDLPAGSDQLDQVLACVDLGVVSGFRELRWAEGEWRLWRSDVGDWRAVPDLLKVLAYLSLRVEDALRANREES